MKVSIFTCIVLFSSLACQQEENPYKDSLRSSESQLSSDQQPENNTNPVSPDANQAQKEPDLEQAEEGSIEEAKLSSTEMICQEASIQAKFSEEMAILCKDGKATNEFANLLATPFDGSNARNFKLVKSEDLNGTSDMIAIKSFLVNLPLAEVFNRRALLNSHNISAGNASLTVSEQSQIAAKGNGHLGGFEVATELVVSVAIITVRNEGLQVRELFDLSGDMSLLADVSYLKENDPINPPGSISNNLVFWIPDGEKTQMIALTRQRADNRGQHNQAEATFSTLSPALTDSTLSALN